MPYRMKFDAERCVGCYACHTACLDAHHEACEKNARSFRSVRRVTDEKKGFSYEICPGCTQCGKCASVCKTGAIVREETYGIYLVEKERCIGCGACERACPQHVIFVDESKKAQKCDGCIERLKEGREPACAAVCFLDVITVENE